jgi:hypothetical protein
MGARKLGRGALAAALGVMALAAVPPARATPTIVPIPEIILDPNEGNTYGVMLATLFKDEVGDVRYMIAPDVRYNETKGVFPVFRLLAYPSDDRFYTIVIGKSTTKDEDYEAEYENYELLDHRAYVEAKVLYEKDSTERFYGFGNDSDEDEESNYTSAIFYYEAKPGYYLRPKLNVSWRTRVMQHEVERGQVDDIPYIAVEHPEVADRGLETAWYWLNRFALTWDSRDSRKLPTEGSFAEAYVDVADRALASDKSFVKFGLEGRKFISFREVKNPTLALRARLDYITGDPDTPFYQLSQLGGRRSLRGYGSQRFIDFNRSLMSAELRTRVWSRKIFGVDLQVELAPFVETGQVFENLGDSPVDDLHWVFGNGFRGLVRPQILAFVDLGYGSEGLAVFTGIDYPF